MDFEKIGMNFAGFFQKTLWAFPVLFLAATVLQAQPESRSIAVGKFSAATPGDSLPDGWTHLTFKKIKRHTRYSVVRENDRVVVKAVSEQSASAMSKNLRIDPAQYPIVEWQWKVGNILRKGDVSKKQSDDYPARIYITFEYDASRVGFTDRIKFNALRAMLGHFPPLGVISYIWGNKAPVGTMAKNAFSDRVAMIVVRSGADNINTWLRERRDVYADYERAFGQKPPMISGVAIMSDSDNTGESATAYFGDITFRKK